MDKAVDGVRGEGNIGLYIADVTAKMSNCVIIGAGAAILLDDAAKATIPAKLIKTCFALNVL
jgi:hypothetical protein